MTLLQKSALARSAKFLANLKPGDFMPAERMLAAEAQVGRTVVRGLFQSLEEDQFILRQGNRWMVKRLLPVAPSASNLQQPLTKRELVKDHLIAELIGGRLKSGQPISELALARQLGVSTVTVREALLKLEPLGALEKTDRRHWAVAAFTESRIYQLREFRELVEIFALRKLIGSEPTAATRALLDANRRKTVQVVENRHTRVREILEVDLEFHRLLLQAAENELLQERADFIYLIIEFQLVSPHFKIEQGKFGLRQHLAIHQAIAACDLSGAEKQLRQHLCAAEKSFCAIVRQIGQ